MNRKQFIESCGATCSNWNWSWSFVNRNDRYVIFGAWDIFDDGAKALILSEDWHVSWNGRRQPGYPQSREHIRLVEEEGYRLMTFPMQHSADRERDGEGPSKINGFTPALTEKDLLRVGKSWYAGNTTNTFRFAEEMDPADCLIEGAAIQVSVSAFERNPAARNKCIDHHGFKCAVCSFDFEDFFGPLGRQYIHVHHVAPLSEIREAHEVDPIRDMVPICPNCHAMIHRTRPALTVDQLRQHLVSRRILSGT